MKNENKIGTGNVTSEGNVKVTRSIQVLTVTTDGKKYIVDYIHYYDSDEYDVVVEDCHSKDIEFTVRVAALEHLHHLYERGL